ncbi:protein-disulfide isomerase [Granulicella aggregans]|uniref:Protein-disulfide isomerase n=1 Tax=Granulicella aggregans TaxID=474949 RepID=A0A7W7ZGK4_9BACT|nr:thioredoxin domain-containing protein [Granulicella aggregans]MBB5058871.1 protein-disulfide isomerase [Granulicella aggregans]
MKIAAIVSTGFAAVLVVGAFGTSETAFAQAAPPSLTAPSAQPAPAAPTDPFPPVNMKYFTTDTPSGDTVNGFLHSLWGYDENRIYRVEGIQKTSAPGVSKVIVYVSDKTPNAKVQSTAFYVMPDGKHAIADTMIDFGINPYAEKRKLLQERANGPAQGAAGKDLLLVEFSDLQCPHCKEAATTMEQLAKDFPKARIVHQAFPLTAIHPAAFQAAAVGACVAKQSTDAYFKYEAAVYATQEALTPEGTAKTLDAAVTKAGLDPAAIDLCAATAETKAAVAASAKLAEEAGIDQTPTLSVNGRMLPVSPAAMPYEILKKIIVFQAGIDGVKVDNPPPSLNTLK